jgi:hypothetical protein
MTAVQAIELTDVFCARPESGGAGRLQLLLFDRCSLAICSE